MGFLFPDKTIKLWKISERDKRAEGYNLKDEDGRLRDPFRITALRVRGSSLTLSDAVRKLIRNDAKVSSSENGVT